MQRRKGRAFEQFCARPLRMIFGAQVKRGWQSRAGSADACDIEATPFKIECKAQKAVNVRAAYAQACDGPGDGIPLAIVKWDRHEPLAVLSFNEFCKMLAFLNASGYFGPDVKLCGAQKKEGA